MEKFVFIQVVLVIVPNVLKLRVKAVLDLYVFAVQIKLVIDEQLSQTNLIKQMYVIDKSISQQQAFEPAGIILTVFIIINLYFVIRNYIGRNKFT